MNTKHKKCSVVCSKYIPYLDDEHIAKNDCKPLFTVDKDGKSKKMGMICNNDCDTMKNIITTIGPKISIYQDIAISLYDPVYGEFEGYLLPQLFDNIDPYSSFYSKHNLLDIDDDFDEDRLEDKKFKIIDNVGQGSINKHFKLLKNDNYTDYDNISMKGEEKSLSSLSNSDFNHFRKFKFENTEVSDDPLIYYGNIYYINANNKYFFKKNKFVILEENKSTTWVIIPVSFLDNPNLILNQNKPKPIREGDKFVISIYPYKVGEGNYLKWENEKFTLIRDSKTATIFSMHTLEGKDNNCSDCIYIPHKEDTRVVGGKREKMSRKSKAISYKTNSGNNTPIKHKIYDENNCTNETIENNNVIIKGEKKIFNIPVNIMLLVGVGIIISILGILLFKNIDIFKKKDKKEECKKQKKGTKIKNRLDSINMRTPNFDSRFQSLI